ncbi:dihydrofolate reductase family protein [Oscillochloris sp. ZM17-4]|uniref:RibD family protein n=1 Tax=Oscillochloris sp. ZM17-4 TaxID=2866714 RepID=UPI001C730872|nr:dihydrofolate reductase family protein [Oscillochloris sp. ZM17-4]MBX0327654.1 dihydrofolate reductase family protein [Oscillochloris sp. ZM17-4]
MSPLGPGSPYTLLFDDGPRDGPGLPAPLRAIYDGDWHLPDPPAQRPYVFTNFVASHDGRISFDEPGRSGGGDVSRHSRHDTWLMALLRARADAIITGSGTLRVARRHLWTPGQVFPDDARTFAELRAAEGRAPVPLLVVASASGDLPADADALRGDPQPALLATTAAGAARARASLGDRPGLSYHISPGDSVDLAALMAELRTRHGVRHLLSEGGARIYGALIAAGMIDETFLTISPIVIGSPPGRPPRPSLVEGVGFSPDAPPRLRPVSLRRAGDYLFQRSTFV